MSGFSLIRTNSDAYAWRCNSCLKEYTNAHEAEDCCIELGEPDELPVYNQSINVIAELKSRRRGDCFPDGGAVCIAIGIASLLAFAFGVAIGAWWF